MHVIARLLPLVVLASAVGMSVGCDDNTTGTIASSGPSCTLHGPTVSPASVSISVGDTAVLKATLPCSSSAGSFVWRSSNPAVVSVDSTNGVVRALAVGQASAIAISVTDTLVKGAAAIVVHPR